jgi:TetR/AcrR family transcriptional repressor of nem operon
VSRTKEFDPAEVLDRALEQFLERGFEATSIEDLVRATGLSRASLYNAFGDKQRLFEAVLDRYEARQMERLRRIMAEAGSPRAAIQRVLESAGARGDDYGCLVVNTGVELAGHNKEIGRRASNSFRGIARLFEEMLAGVARVENPAAVARVLESAFLGLRVLRRTGEPPARIQRIARETVELLLPVES